MVYLRVTAEGCGDNGQALNDALEAPQVNPLNPGARDYAVAQRRQHYLQHQQRKQQIKGAEGERESSKRKMRGKQRGHKWGGGGERKRKSSVMSRKEKEGKKEG